MRGGIRDRQINTHGHTQNCYYCTVSALVGKSTSKVVAQTQTMQQDQAEVKEILDLFRSAGFQNIQCLKGLLNKDQVEDELDMWLDEGDAIGLAYVRSDRTGHMVVLLNDGGQKRCIDFQKPPGNRETGFPPESNILGYYVFCGL
ncbi:hypothetical protein DZC73_11320 [Albitalea terrae]|uniref:Tox-PL domain-containing protein n=1 Tax=Piscinibacter terrae TaxID=2496871 RepID=A0A3N7HUB8_9BURK|nr:hypothetical protein DZC73_11320 [Albitalea terrae]